MPSFTNPVIHATADALAVGDYNTVANNTLALWQKPYIMAYNSVITALTSGVFTQVTLGGLTASGYGFSVSSNNIVVPLTGIYSVQFAITAVPATTSVLESACYHNGSFAIAGSGPANISGVNMVAAGGGLISCTASDTLALEGFQGTGSPLNTVVGATNTFLHVTFMGSQ